jgi:GT2 family glycosyltransferase
MTDTLSIGIVSFNSGAVLADTLSSVLGNLPSTIPSQVWLLDNGSADESLAIANQFARSDSRLSVIANGRNRGFAHGHNRILEQVDSTFHVFCNPDVALTTGTLDTLVTFLRQTPDAAVVCPRVHFTDGRLQPLNRRHPTLWDLFLRRFMPRPLRRPFDGRMRRYDMRDRGYESSYDVPFVSGAFMMVRTAIVKAAGGFDERYFLYFEDADLSRTMQERGWRTIFCPDAVITHAWRREAHSSVSGALVFCVSAFRYFNKWGWRLL